MSEDRPVDTDPALQITQRDHGDCVELAVVGEVDLQTAPRFAEAFDRALAQEPQRIVLDCAGLTYLDSTGIAVLARAWEAMKGRATMPVEVVHVQPLVQQVLEACGISGLVTDPGEGPAAGAPPAGGG